MSNRPSVTWGTLRGNDGPRSRGAERDRDSVLKAHGAAGVRFRLNDSSPIRATRDATAALGLGGQPAEAEAYSLPAGPARPRRGGRKGVGSPFQPASLQVPHRKHAPGRVVQIPPQPEALPQVGARLADPPGASGHRAEVAQAEGLTMAIVQLTADREAARETVLRGGELAAALRGNRQGVATCWNNLGIAAQRSGELPAAEDCFTRSLAIRRELNDRQGEALCLSNIGAVAGRAGRIGEACSHLRESLRLRRDLDDAPGSVSCIESLGEMLAETENLPLSARLIAAARALRERLGLPLPQVDRQDQEAAVASLVARMGEESFRRETDAGSSMSLEDAIALALGAA